MKSTKRLPVWRGPGAPHFRLLAPTGQSPGHSPVGPIKELPLINISPLPDRTNLLASITYALTHALTLDTVLLRSIAKEAKSNAFRSMQIVGQSRLVAPEFEHGKLGAQARAG